MFECQIYENLRNKYIDKYYTTRPSMFKFVELLILIVRNRFEMCLFSSIKLLRKEQK